MDRMRESIFGALGDLTGLSFLDLFSGSGIVALEAASRGAAPVEAVEQDPLKRQTLLSNTALAPQGIRCRFMAVELYVRRAKGPFDLIFCDPPFSYGYKAELLGSIAASRLMGEGTTVILHHPRNDPEREGLRDPAPGRLFLARSRNYGRSAASFFRGLPGPQATPGGASGEGGSG
jgi:16S rRNA (guanine(966)-N(2))-methyltransferase RsmD